LPAFEGGKDYPEDNTYGLKEGNPKTWQHWTPFTYFFNLTKQPASSVPIGFTKDKLPIGIQVIGRLYDDDLVLNASHIIQKNISVNF
jgi:aspartyl-tRNA(Asn)/glutamyl-tRNA(Gln) amidotransferase subunit A